MVPSHSSDEYDGCRDSKKLVDSTSIIVNPSDQVLNSLHRKGILIDIGKESQVECSDSSPNGSTSVVPTERLTRMRSRPDSLDLSPNASQKRKLAAAAALNEEARLLNGGKKQGKRRKKSGRKAAAAAAAAENESGEKKALTTNDDGDLVDLEANDENELFLTTSKIAADDNDNEEDGEQQKGEGSLTEGLCFNVMIGVTIMVVILAIGSAMLWTAQRLMNVSQDHHAASKLGAVPGLPVTVFSATSVDNVPYLAGLVPADSDKIVHPKDLSAYLAGLRSKVKIKARHNEVLSPTHKTVLKDSNEV